MKSEKWPRHLRTLQLVGIGFIVFFLPLMKGGMLAWAKSVMVVAIGSMFIMEWFPRVVLGRWPTRWEQGWIIPWLVISTYILFQLIPLPTWLGNTLGAYPDYFRQQVGVVRISTNILETAGYWAIFTAYWIAAWIVASLGRRQIVVLVATIAVLAGFEGVYGMVAFAQGQETILGLWPKVHYVTDVTGTFVNRNHLAGLLAVSFPLGLALIFLGRQNGGFRLRKEGRYALACIFSLLLGLALLNTHSRLGVFSAVLGLLLWLGIERHSIRSSAKKIPRIIPLIILLIVTIAGIWFDLAPLVSRFSGLTTAVRYEVWAAVLALPWQTWIMGAGVGSFQDVFLTVQPAAILHTYKYAHNDWLEFFVEFGVVGTITVGMVLIYWFRRTRPVKLSFLQRAAVGGVFAIAVHSLGDFNLRIPGTALAFWVTVGILFNKELGEGWLAGEQVSGSDGVGGSY